MDLEHEIKREIKREINHELKREIKREIKEEEDGEEEGELKATAAMSEEEPGEIASRSGEVDSRSTGAPSGSLKHEGSFVDEMLDDGEIHEEIEGEERGARARIKSDEADEAEGAPTKARSAPPKNGKTERASAGAAHDGAAHEPSAAAAAAESNTGGTWLHRVRAALDREAPSMQVLTTTPISVHMLITAPVSLFPQVFGDGCRDVCLGLLSMAEACGAAPFRGGDDL